MVSKRVGSLALAGLAALLVGCDDPGRPSILLIVVDTLRADHLEPWGAPSGSSPNVAGLAASGTLFRDAVAASPWTGPSVASIVSGRYPDRVGVRGLRHRLPDSVAILPQILADAGYATAAIVSNGLAGPAIGNDRGYDHYHFEHYRSQGGGTVEAGRPDFTADRVTDRAIEWIDGARRPFFLYVHYTDPHEPYLPPVRWREAQPESGADIDDGLLLAKRFTRRSLDDAELVAVRSRYRAEVAFVDHEIGRLLAAAGDDVLVAFTGDHGEEFREHGGFLHGHTLYQELLHVPLILAGAGVPKGVTVPVPVSHVDILPTLVARAGLPLAAETDGIDLLARADGRPDAAADRVLFALREGPTTRCVAARSGPWKLSTCRGAPGNAVRDLRRDPAEIQRKPPDSAEVEAALARAVDEHGRRAVAPAAAADPATARSIENALRAIGYVE